MMDVSLRINQKELIKGLQNGSRGFLNTAMHKAAIGIQVDLKVLIENLLTHSPEYSSIAGGILKQEFHLEDVQASLDRILTTLQNSLSVATYPVSWSGYALNGGIVIKMIRADFADLLGLNEGDWLEWLLTRGDSIILSSTNISFNPKEVASAKGIAKLDAGGGFRVPPEFAGVLNDNWITRTFDLGKVQKLVSNIVIDNIKKQI